MLCCRAQGGYCDRCDLLVGLPGLHVVAVERDGRDRLRVPVESPPTPMGCPTCGSSRTGTAASWSVWSMRRRWAARSRSCGASGAGCARTGPARPPRFVEQDERIGAPRAMLTARACRWAIQQILSRTRQRQRIRRRLRTGWRTVWSRSDRCWPQPTPTPLGSTNVTILGVHEHGWHHVSTKPPQLGVRRPKQLTGLLDLTRDEHGRIHARLLDLFPGRSGEDLQDRLRQRGEAFRPESRSPPALWTKSAAGSNRTSTATAATRTTRCTGFGTSCALGQEYLTDRQRARLVTAFTSDQRHVEVEVAWSCAQQVRAAFHQDSHAAGRTIAEKILDTFASCPIPEVTRLGRTLRHDAASSSATSTPTAPQTVARKPSTA